MHKRTAIIHVINHLVNKTFCGLEIVKDQKPYKSYKTVAETCKTCEKIYGYAPRSVKR